MYRPPLPPSPAGGRVQFPAPAPLPLNTHLKGDHDEPHRSNSAQDAGGFEAPLHDVRIPSAACSQLVPRIGTSRYPAAPMG